MREVGRGNGMEEHSLEIGEVLIKLTRKPLQRCWSGGLPCKWRDINAETFNLLTFQPF